MIVLENIKKRYEDDVALDGIHLQINKGEFVFLTGPSGAGKTTLLNLLLKEIEPDEGKITVNGINLGKITPQYMYRYRRILGVVFQDFRLIPEWTIYENVAFAQRVIGVTSGKIKKNVSAVLKLVGIEQYAKHYPREMSGGEMQRAAIARAIINRPYVLLADEPTRNLDRKNAIEIMNLLEKINEMGTTVIMSTHNREIVNALGKRVVTLENGKIVNDCKNGRYFYGQEEEMMLRFR
ncbi:MAG: ATP-binding cassette domain-containing protein [Candidatus Ruminococcus intestinipullorum]|nr:ATP-binding cassette domain-containing protein [Candidatus Ruminococcus intestinipullorum]